ncbi:MAG: hypothetical protein EHM55_07205, partial [Acidobacteria bacterium]
MIAIRCPWDVDWCSAIVPNRGQKYERQVAGTSIALHSVGLMQSKRRETMRLPLQIVLAVAVLASASTARAQMRFQAMDRNNDGVITRSEWRGNVQSFRNQDWNGDGVLSGDEVRAGGRRQTDWSQDWNRDGRVDGYDRQIAQRYSGYDLNHDNRVGRSEWRGDGRLFVRLDANRDGYVTLLEYAQGNGYNLDALGGPAFSFSTIDMNNDGWVTR